MDLNSLPIIGILVLVSRIFDTVSATCQPTLTLNFMDREEGQGVNLECNVEDCDSEEVLFQKKVHDTYETAIKFTSRTEFQGYKLTNGVDYNDSRIVGVWFINYIVEIKETIVEDTGLWQCSVDGKDGTEKNLNINSNPSNIQLSIRTPPFILLGSEHEYECSAIKVNPELDVLWNINGKNYSGVSGNKPNWDVFDIIDIYRDTLNQRLVYIVKCFMGVFTGNNTWSIYQEAQEVTIFAPTILEEFHIPDEQPNPSNNLTMSCTVSGSSASIEWLHNDSDINTSLFTKDEQILQGNFTFGEPTAFRSTLVWILPDQSKWCSELGKYGGQFQCIGNSAKGPEVESDEEHIIVQYTPVLPNDFAELEATEHDTISLECKVDCAMPPVHTYQWSSLLNRPGLDGNEQVIRIILTKADFYDTFTCEAINDIGSSSISFVISEKEQSSTTTAICPSIADGGDMDSGSGIEFGVSFAIGLTVGVVICGALFAGYAVYHRIYLVSSKTRCPKQSIYENENVSENDDIQYKQADDLRYQNTHREVTSNNDDLNQAEPSKYEAIVLNRSKQLQINSTYDELKFFSK